jgi:subtilase family serine protease
MEISMCVLFFPMLPMAVFASLLVFMPLESAAQDSTTRQSRIHGALSNSNMVPSRGNRHPRATTKNNLGAVNGSVRMSRLTLFFKTSAAQQAELEILAKNQRDPRAPQYHAWLTPQEYGARFGLSDSDLNRTQEWLQSLGFRIDEVVPSQNAIVFSGTVQQVESAFQTSINNFSDGQQIFYSNLDDPSLPAALEPLVLGIRSLNNYRLRPRAKTRSLNPSFTSSISGNHYLAPDDIATIYSIKGLYTLGIKGSGQKIAVVGQSSIRLADIETFRSNSGLSANNPTVVLVPGSSDPGIQPGDVVEANLDIQWSGAIAPNAQITYVNSGNGVLDSLQYAITQNLAPVISISYGACELEFSASDVAILTSLALQANVQGQAITAASGDSGAADCDYSNGSTEVTSAIRGLAVDLPASLPYVTAVGGTRLNEGSGTYWESSNNSSNGSAISYIPEISWNDTSEAIAASGGLSSSGGGKSTLFLKPNWQSGNGVPADGMRNVPDVSFHASPYHDGYLICSLGSCVNGFRASDNSLIVIGGTSAGAPVLAGILALVNEKMAAVQGNPNASLYSIAGAFADVFHDVTEGDNKVPCTAGTTDCPNGGTIGYSATTGYDLVTGLGSIDVSALIGAFAHVGNSSMSDFKLSANSATVSVSRGGSAEIRIAVASLGKFSGLVNLSCELPSTLSNVTCALTPTSIDSNGISSLTIVASSVTSASSQLTWVSFALTIPLIGVTRRVRQLSARRSVVLLGLALVLIISLAACGGSSSTANEEKQTGTITVTGVSGTISHQVPISATVQ